MFFKNSRYQDNYFELKGDCALLSVEQFGKLSSDSILSFKQIGFDDLHLIISRDKSLPPKPLQHKLMPTQLISSVKLPFSIDTISLKNNTVVYKEFEVKTKAWSEIPFSALNGNIVNVSNHINRRDSNLEGKLFTADIKRFSYRESYVDTLAGFSADVNFSAIDLRDFSNMSRTGYNLWICR
ncbi:hypothetical protein [Chryseobacterium sp. G0201]|uniref:hypothetical protein n=1 Tax=Chryseobacterium sp. G0201 TaxID=2487065 RepID=UPI000F4D401E|nr:hypothetical protein [Chryseobacterium sp. G0201]AZA53975.1 hypothetical protein EG348_13680 [Chryseobacterium sp. G0201]